jgi:tetratricopeptide (TPR) repeat protein
LLNEALEILNGIQKHAAGNALIQSTVSMIHHRLGRLYYRQDKRAQAREHLQIAIDRLEPAYAANLDGSGLADSLQLMAAVIDDHNEAIELLDRAQVMLHGLLELRPDNVELKAMLETNKRTRQMLNDQAH